MRWRSGASQSERCAVGSGRRWLSDDLAEKTKRCAVGWHVPFFASASATDSLYRVDNQTDSSGYSSNQAGSMSLAGTVGLSGSQTGTLTITGTLTPTATDITTLVFGAGGTIASGSQTDTLYETGNDTTYGPAAGSNVRQFAYSGQGSASATYTTTFSATDSESETFTESQSDVAALGAAGLVASGSDFSSLTDPSTSYSTLSESGGRTVSYGLNSLAGSYTDTESGTFSDSSYDGTSLALGTSGTLAGGTDSHSHAGFDSHSQSYTQGGWEVAYDPAGGPPYGVSASQISLVTTSLFGSDSGTITLAARGSISGGNDSFTLIQADSNSHSMAGSTATEGFTDYGSDTFYQDMLGTETLGPGGTVSGGADSFTWAQSASDYYGVVQYGGGTGSLATDYYLSAGDVFIEDFSDSGTDLLGASDTILGGSDTYTWYTRRDLATTLINSGTSVSPSYVSGYFWDQMQQGDTGSSTLTTDGHVYATDTIGYVENTGNTATASQSSVSSGGSSLNSGGDYDYYINNDATTQTVSDGTTTSYDSFTLADTHSIYGHYSEVNSTSLSSITLADGVNDSDYFYADGVKSSTGDQYTFSTTEATGEDLLFTDVLSGSYTLTGGMVSAETMGTYGTEWHSGTITSYSEHISSWTSEQLSDSGSSTYYVINGGATETIVEPYSEVSDHTGTYAYQVTGPPAATVTLLSQTYDSDTGSTPSNIPFLTLVIGNTGDGYVVERLGQSAGGGDGRTAVHLGTSPNSLNGSQGLVSALGGLAAHGLSYAGGDLAAVPTGNGLVIEDSDRSVGAQTALVAYPMGIGYRRAGSYSNGGSGSGSGSGGGSGSGSGGGSTAGNAPVLDSGTSDGSDQAELTRLSSYNTGANENPNVGQAAPTSRAAQATTGAVNDAATTGATGGGGRPAQAAAGNANGAGAGNTNGRTAGMPYGAGGGGGGYHIGGQEMGSDPLILLCQLGRNAFGHGHELTRQPFPGRLDA